MLIFSQKLKLLMLLLVMVLFFKILNYFRRNLSSKFAGVGIFGVNRLPVICRIFLVFFSVMAGN